jgi:hypothetical protein
VFLSNKCRPIDIYDFGWVHMKSSNVKAGKVLRDQLSPASFELQ